MYAFGLEESGNYPARRAARARRPRRATPTTSGPSMPSPTSTRCKAGSTRASASSGPREADWGDGNLFTVHNWWHLALYLLEAGDADESLAIYDRHIHNAAIRRRAPRDARRQRPAVAPPPRRSRRRRSLRPTRRRLGNTHVADEPWYVFNDLHAVMALAGAGRLDDAERSSIGCRPTSQRAHRHPTSG